MSDEDSVYKFDNFKRDNIAEGSIYSAYLNITGNGDSSINNIPNEISSAHHVRSDIFPLEMIPENINKYNTLIDAGAIYRNYTAKSVIDAIYEITSFSKYIYFNDDHLPVTIIKSIGGHNINENSEFIYYDHKHTVGIDYKQPYTAMGLVTINYFNRYTDVSQAIFRLRNMNYGHFVNFITYNLPKNINNRRSLLKHLLSKETEYNNSTLPTAIIQQLKYKYRARTNEYTEEVFNEINYLMESKNTYSSNTYIEWFMKNWKDKVDKKLLDSLSRVPKSVSKNLAATNIVLNVEQERSIVSSLNINIENNRYDERPSLKIRSWGLHNYIFHYAVKDFLVDNGISKLLRMLNIYISPAIFMSMTDMLNRETSDMFPYYNYSLITVTDNDKQYSVIITGWEAMIMYFYVSESDEEVKISLYDKNCNIIRSNCGHGSPSKKGLIKYILCGNYNIYDILTATGELLSLQKSHNIEEVLDDINLYFGTSSSEDSLHKLLAICKRNNIHDISEFLASDIHITEYLTMTGMKVSEEIISEIRENFTDMKGGKYRDLHLKKSSRKYR